MPADPIMRARARLFLHRFEQELFIHVKTLEGSPKKSEAEKAREGIRDGLTTIAPVFAKQKFMLGDDFSMIDVAVAPLLWRLESYGIDLGRAAAPILKYSERIFTRQAFIDSLTPAEKAMRK